MRFSDSEYDLVADMERVDFAKVRDWLSQTYWSRGVTIDRVIRAAKNSSLVISVFDKFSAAQVGYARVISDRTTFGYLTDVVVDEAYRGKGIAKAMVKFALEHPEHQGFRRWTLTTDDAQALYAQFGFKPSEHPEHWMELRESLE